MDTIKARHIASLTERLSRLLFADAHASPLLPVQWEALRYLNCANRFSKTSSALTAFLGSTKGTVSQTIKTLEARGLVANTVDPNDRRRNQLSLLEKGKELLAKDPIEKLVETIASQPEASMEALANGLEKLLSSRLKGQGRHPFGHCRDCIYFRKDHEDGDPHFCALLGEKLSKTDSEAICHEQITP